MNREYCTDSDIKGLELKELDELMSNNTFNSFEEGFDSSPVMKLETFEELMERDKQREKDGFPRKIKVRKLMKGDGKSKDKVIVIPFAEEEKLVHEDFNPETPQDTGGKGEGEEGEEIGEEEVDEGEAQEGDEQGEPGGESGGEHGLSRESYEIGKYLSEKLDLPNLEDKGKKIPISEWTYDLTDKTKKRGQFLDKVETVKSILKTNLMLGTIDPNDIDTSKLIVSPNDKVYKTLSRERQYQSQAIVFFVRDYSGSMHGEPTKTVCSLHTMLYTWLVYQYEERVIPRFIVHDTEAKEVADFNEYYASKTGGGTFISSAYELVNDIIDREGLEKDYNLYIFQGSDGDDWRESENKSVKELESLLNKCNRIGISIVPTRFNSREFTTFERYIKDSGLLKNFDLLRMIRMNSSDESELEETLKMLVSE